MDIPLHTLDWSHVRSFLAVAQTGSLSAAARAIGQSQPTLGRHIRAAEQALGVRLFDRVPGGLVPTQEGQRLIPAAQDMALAYARLSNIAAGQDDRPSGTVRITASEVVSHYVLPPIIAEMRRIEPAIEIELAPSDSTQNLIFREADIAIRMFRPTQLDVIARKVKDQPFALYGAVDLLARVGDPATPQDMMNMPFVGFDRSDLIVRQMRNFDPSIDRHFFGTRCDDQAAYWELVKSGCGIGAMQTHIGDSEPKVRRLGYQPPLPDLPIWLAAHEAVYPTARVSRVWNILADRLRAGAARQNDLVPSTPSG